MTACCVMLISLSGTKCMAQGLLNLLGAGIQIADGLARVGSSGRREQVPPVVVRRWPQFRRVALSGKAPTGRERAQTRWLEARTRYYAAPGDEAELVNWLGVCEQLGEVQEADAAWRTFLDQPGAEPSHRLGHARWLVRNQLRDDARVEVLALYQLPTPPRGTASLLGQLLVDDHAEEARAVLMRAVMEDPDDTDAAGALAALTR